MYAEICRISPFPHPEQPRHTAFAAVGIPLPLFPDYHGKNFFLHRHAVKFHSSFPETEYLPLNVAGFVHPHRAGSFFLSCGLRAAPRCRGPPASEIKDLNLISENRRTATWQKNILFECRAAWLK